MEELSVTSEHDLEPKHSRLLPTDTDSTVNRGRVWLLSGPPSRVGLSEEGTQEQVR